MLAGVGVGFNKHLTGLENTYLYAALMGWKKEDVDQQLGEILAFFLNLVIILTDRYELIRRG